MAALSKTMEPGLSLTLDAWRLAACLAVMLCHFGSRRLSAGLFWQLTPYGAEAVDVFFVLSGYVIAFATTRQAATAGTYGLARLRRLWSVSIPAACLTFALDGAGRAIQPDAYAALPGDPQTWSIVWQGLAGVLFVNQLWGAGIPVGANIPWWSLGYEAPYYLAYGFFRFGGTVWRIAAPLLLALAAGPSIALLSLLWIAGAAVRHCHDRVPPTGAIAWLLCLIPVPLWIGYEIACHRLGRPFDLIPHLRAECVQDLIVGGLFALHLLGAPAVLRAMPPCPMVLARAVRVGAACSFSVYLLHYPVMLFLRACMLRSWPWASPVWLLPATFAICVGAAALGSVRRDRGGASSPFLKKRTKKLLLFRG